MKFIHLSNVNLGAEPMESPHLTADRAGDAWNDFLQVLSVCREEEVDALFITGTLFVRTPEERELRDLDDHFYRLADTRVFFAPGALPGGGDNSIYSDFPWRSNTHVFTGDSIQRIHVARLSMEVTGVGYLEKSWHKVKPYGLTRGRKGAIQILLMPFAGNSPDTGSPDDLKSLPFDYMGFGQTRSFLSENGNRIYAPGSFQSTGFEDSDRHGFIMGKLDDEGRKRAGIRCEFVPVENREYLEIRVNANEEISYQEVEEQVRNAISNFGDQNIYRILITGAASSSLYIMKNNLYRLGNVFEIIDETDAEAARRLLQRGSEETAVTRFVDQVLSEEDSEVKQKAIQYGMDALLDL
ncbi:MAG: hypothetical protein IKS18_05020 [Lachnospiraceae bacterium]|nr:hypothetical protein [Lachnospiraceae bacterium]